jgi:hypothetical protein
LIINRLTVGGRDYFLPDPVEELREKILAAIRAGGGYVAIPPINGGAGVEILFSPGLPIMWTRLDLSGEEPLSDSAHATQREADARVFDDL